MSSETNSLKEKRNKKLVERYYYLFEIKRFRYDDVLKHLSEEEFFVSEERISRLLSEDDAVRHLQMLKRKNPPKQLLVKAKQHFFKTQLELGI